MNLALFDLDNTLLSGDTDVEWLEFLVGRGLLDAGAHAANVEMDRRYRAGEAPALEYVRFYLRLYPRYEMALLLELRQAFLEERIKPRMLPAARELIDRHREDLAVIITATNRFLTEPIAQAFGIEHLIATEPQIAGERFTGDIVGAPCMREGKLEHLSRWLAARGQAFSDFSCSFFYSDSINDLPLLERVTHPVAVDPDPQLKALANERAWRSISLRAR